MRDNRFKAIHRRGPLDLRRHRLLSSWAADCAEHVLRHFGAHAVDDERPENAIHAARAWARGEISAGIARRASFEAHAAAREARDPAARAAARSAGHAAATAHMADHAKGAALYAIKAVSASRPGESSEVVNGEREWQRKQLPTEIRDLIDTTSEV